MIPNAAHLKGPTPISHRAVSLPTVRPPRASAVAIQVRPYSHERPVLRPENLGARVIRKKKEASVKFVMGFPNADTRQKDEREHWSYLQSKFPDAELYFREKKPVLKPCESAPKNDFSSFMQSLNELIPEIQVLRLEAFIYDEMAGGLTRFTTTELSQVYGTFKRLKAYDAMVEMMETCPNIGFRENLANLLDYARANLKSSYFNPGKVIKIMNRILNDHPLIAAAHFIKGLAHANKCFAAKDVVEMKSHFVQDKEVIELYFRCFNIEKKEWTALAQEHYEEELKLSIEALKKAYELKFDPLVGSFLINQYQEKGCISKALELSEEIWLKGQSFWDNSDLTLSQIKAIIRAGRLCGQPEERIELWNKRVNNNKLSRNSRMAS